MAGGLEIAILMDTREKCPLTFEFVHGVSVKSECLASGDYGARYSDGLMDNTVIERKSIPDLFQSFTKGYANEKAKWTRAHAEGKKYVLAVEAPASVVVRGCTYEKGGKTHRVKKTGIAQVRQCMTVAREYGVEVWWCQDKTDMAFRIQEYFLAGLRLREKGCEVKG